MTSSQVDQMAHLTVEDKSYLIKELEKVDALSSRYHHDYYTAPKSFEREGEVDFLASYDPRKYGIDPSDAVFTADNIIFTRGQDDELKVLLIQRGNHPYKGFWCQPGGFVDDGESTQDAAVRELEEETGVKLESSNVLHVGTYNRMWRDPRMAHIITSAHVVFVPELPDFAAGDDAAEAGLFTVSDIFAPGSELELGFDHKQIVADAVSFLLRG
jgi:8-oxo-dGTP diphosphatase